MFKVGVARNRLSERDAILRSILISDYATYRMNHNETL